MKLNSQSAPYPEALASLVSKLEYKPGWSFTLEDITRRQGGTGLTLSIRVAAEDVYNPGQPLTFRHHMPVPAVEYSKRAWQRWLLNQVRLVENHEMYEAFRIGGERVFAPLHHRGADQYMLTETAADLEDRASDYLCNYETAARDAASHPGL